MNHMLSEFCNESCSSARMKGAESQHSYMEPDDRTGRYLG